MCFVLSTKSVQAPREVQTKWLRTAVLGACAVLAGLLLWSRLGGDDSITEVLAHRSEILPGRFIEVPCSEDYDSHRRFEGRRCCCGLGRGSPSTGVRGVGDATVFWGRELVGIRLKVVCGLGTGYRQTFPPSGGLTYTWTGKGRAVPLHKGSILPRCPAL